MQHPSPAAAPTGWRPRLCFLGYRHLNALAEQVLPEYASRAHIELLDASFDSAAAAARERERAAAVDVFVTAGSNAAIVRETATLPVATIQLDGYDLLLALLQARRHGNRVGVVSYRDTIASLDEVKELLNIDIAQCAYLYPDEARACFDHFADDGRSVIVGSSIAVELARQRGLHGILAYSASAVRRGIEDAIAMAHVARRESTRHEQVHAVLHNLQEAVLATDAAQRIVAANSAMQRVLGARLEALRGRPLAEVEPVLAQATSPDPGAPSRSQVLQLAGREWVAHHTPLHDGERGTGTVIALHDAQAIEEAGSRLRAQRRQRRPAGSRYRFSDLLGQAPLFLHCVDSARRFARTDLTVLITGESGTGKELFAQAIHDTSTRAGRPFVALNCSALPETLLESELFGHEEGAFTGSRRGGKPGLFEAAHQGTLFLDEIGDMPLVLQTRLLRVLQEREVTRLGGATPIPVDVRIVAATHQPLAEMITRRQFRADLYFRLNVLRIALPPLRSRPGDVLLLAGAALQRALARLASPLRAEELLQRVAPSLLRHDWPGNVRELENICERVAVFFSAYAHAAAAPLEQLLLDCPELADTTPGPSSPPPDLQAVLAACGGNRNAAAAQLGISRATLWRRIRAARQAGAPAP